MNFYSVVAICFMLISHIYLTYAELYTSTAAIEDLLETRRKLIEDLQSYIVKEEKRLSNITRYLNIYKREQGRVKKDTSYYLRSPLNYFVLIKSLSIDLTQVKREVLKGKDNINNVTFKYRDCVYPTLKDLKGTASGLRTLIRLYKLDVRELVEGTINGVKTSTPLSASDCYELGRELYKAQDYELGRALMEEAFRKYYEEHIVYPFTDINILEHIGYGSYLLGDISYGKKWIKRILDIDPNNQKANFTNTLFQNMIDEEKRSNMDTNAPSKNQNSQSLKEKQDEQRDVNYNNSEELCRGDMNVSLKVSRRLNCRYLTDSHPFMKLAPIKIEMIHLNPDLLLFHDVLSDREIETLKRIAKPRLQRTKFIDKTTGQEYTQDGISVSKTAVVHDKEFRVLSRISKRITQITGLSAENTRSMEIVNYGVGGSFYPHNNLVKVTPETHTKTEDRRIASIMFYLSDVTQGGATVFTKLGVKVAPVKATALFWYNLHPSGERNHVIHHAECPVLQGSKWVLIKYLYQAGQELRKPCNLESEEEGFQGSIPQPVLKKTRYQRQTIT